jgi:hypothetical protein
MPRQSVESRSAAAWRTNLLKCKSLQEPPEDLSDDARKLWAKVLASKSADWFDDGSLPILAQYCDLLAEHTKLVREPNALNQLKPVDILDRTALSNARIRINKLIIDHMQASATRAVKLRLSVQNTIDRKSGMLDEKQPEATAVNPLLAGRRLNS